MSTLGPMRRFGLTLAVAGIAALGGVAVAPAASAAPSDNAQFVIDQDGNKVRIPALCDIEKPKKHHKTCIDLVVDDRF